MIVAPPTYRPVVMRERLAAEGIEPNDLDADGFTRFVRAEVARWAPVAKAAK
jgi:tripartite-type tricarboxylate transporter receptor subunit TctC